MFLSDLAGKEIINLYDGSKLGLVGDADIEINANGGIEAIIISSRGGFSGFFGGGRERERERDRDMVIPWKAVKKVGPEVIIVDMHNKSEKMRKYSI